jgi:glutathione synthase/RimK-type ligase-like ATP-grasp enzyme
MSRLLVVGLDGPEIADLKHRHPAPAIYHPLLPQIRLDDGRLLVERASGPGMLPVDRVVFHGIFADDYDFLTALALWGGPCLPSARGLLDCRERLPCLARALKVTRFGHMPRSWATRGQTVERAGDTVAKWGNWHCGENKHRFTGTYTASEPTILEPFIVGEAVRIALVGAHAWQIRLAGDDWLHSIHHPRAAFMPIDDELLADTRALSHTLGLEVIGVDYMVGADGQKHLLEVNHAANVTVFPEIREAFLDLVAAWADPGPA